MGRVKKPMEKNNRPAECPRTLTRRRLQREEIRYVRSVLKSRDSCDGVSPVVARWFAFQGHATRPMKGYDGANVYRVEAKANAKRRAVKPGTLLASCLEQCERESRFTQKFR